MLGRVRRTASSRCCGVALIIWALPRLARRCGLDAGLVLWLGAANPLVLFHLVSGIHNEALMIGLMLAGVELGLRALDRGAAVPARSAVRARRGASSSLGAAVKLPALLALGFLGMAAARAARRAGARRRRGRRRVLGRDRGRGLRRAGGRAPGWASAGRGTLGTANVIRSWMSLATDLGQLSGQVGILAGLGDHTDTVLDASPAGSAALVAALLCLRLLLLVLRGRLDPVTGLGVGLGAVVLLGPVVHPWYLLWAAIPLAATRGMPRHRRAALAASALLAVMLPPDGRRLRVPVLPAADGDPRRDRHPRWSRCSSCGAELRAAGPRGPRDVLDDVEPAASATSGGAPLDARPHRLGAGPAAAAPGRTSRVPRPRPAPGPT